jgi:hypothetical protein
MHELISDTKKSVLHDVFICTKELVLHSQHHDPIIC